MNEEQTLKRLKEIITIANYLSWTVKQEIGYPTMQISEVEKCMIAMVDDIQLDRMKVWQKEYKPKQINQGGNKVKDIEVIKAHVKIINKLMKDKYELFKRLPENSLTKKEKKDLAIYEIGDLFKIESYNTKFQQIKQEEKKNENI